MQEPTTPWVLIAVITLIVVAAVIAVATKRR